MKKLVVQGMVVVTIALSAVLVAQQAQQAKPAAPAAPASMPLGTPGPNIPAGKAPEQGYVPDGWYPHEGGLLKYRVAIRFGLEPVQTPSWYGGGRMSDVANDAQGNVYVIQRGEAADPVCVLDPTGKFLRGWGKGMFGSGHGIRVDREGNVWTVDTVTQQILKFTSDGKLLQSWGQLKVAGTDKANTFNRPTNVGWDSQGNTYISDGYGNSRVVKLDKSGKYLMEWGTPGDGPSQFRLPHVVAVDSKDRIYISDRENNRIQIFDTNGKLIKIWTHVGSVQSIFITPKDEIWLNTHRNNTENIVFDTLEGRLMKLDLESGKILASAECPGHGMSVSPNGDIFVASLTGNVFRWYPYEAKWPQKPAK